MNTEVYIEHALKAWALNKTIIITGLPGCGKSALVQKLINKIQEEQPPVRIISINPRESRWKHISDAMDLMNTLRGLGVGATAVFIDNADMIDGFETILPSIEKEKNVRLCITGKMSGTILSKAKNALNAHVQEIRVHPVSYAGFLENRHIPHSTPHLREYIACGGLPKVISMPKEFRTDYLEKITASILLDEIIEPYNIRNVRQLRMMLSAICSYTGVHISTRMICKWFYDRNIVIAPQTVLDFLHVCEQSGILLSIPLINISTNKTISKNALWYFGDTGLRSMCKTYAGTDKNNRTDENEVSHAVENSIFLSLLDTGWNVSRGKIETSKKNTSNSITFVCEKDERRVYMQLIPANCPINIKSKMQNSLLAIRDGWEKILIDSDSLPRDKNGIPTVSITELLLQNSALINR